MHSPEPVQAIADPGKPITVPVDTVVRTSSQKQDAGTHVIARPRFLPIKLKVAILGLPGIWAPLIPFKFYKLFRLFIRPRIAACARTSFQSREVCNYSYHHTEASLCRLTLMMAYQLDGVSVDDVRRYCAEVGNNRELQALYQETRATDKLLRNLTDTELRPGRQLLYYCLVRIMKPCLIFEAGTAHGIGSLLLLHALMRNVEEGHPGRLVTVDINPNAGKLLVNLPASYKALLDFECADSESRLARAPEGIDLFLHDTVNIGAHEARHYSLLQKKLSARGIICTTWGTSGQLASHACQHGRRYFEFTSEASGHWCSDTLGISAPTPVSLNRTAADITSPGRESS